MNTADPMDIARVLANGNERWEYGSASWINAAESLLDLIPDTAWCRECYKTVQMHPINQRFNRKTGASWWDYCCRECDGILLTVGRGGNADGD